MIYFRSFQLIIKLVEKTDQILPGNKIANLVFVVADLLGFIFSIMEYRLRIAIAIIDCL